MKTPLLRSLTACARQAALVILLGMTVSLASAAEDRRARVLNDRTDVESAGYWIYNDLSKGFQEAARTGKPLLVVLRCVP